jgi:pilus assembly protein CpaC
VLCRALLVALSLCVLLPALAAAQEPAKPPVLTGSLIVPIGGTQRLQMSKKQVISKAINRNEAVLRVSPVYGDPTTVLLNGLEPGVAIVTLIDEANKEENYQIVVQLDVEYLKTLLRRAVPTANIDPIPGANNTIVLNGIVPRAEDIEVALRIAQSVVLGPDRVINHLRVDGVQQVQLCVTVAAVSRQDFRAMAFNFLYSGRDTFFGSTVGQAVVNPATIGLGGVLSNNGRAIGSPGTPNGASVNAFFGVIGNGATFLGFLQALRDEQVTKLLAEPRLVTISGKAASFLSGGEQAVPVPAGLGQVGVQFEEFGTRLNFLPIVMGDGRIHLEVEPEVSSLNQANGTSIQGTVVPGRTTQRVHTTVDIEPGQTLVIGGLIQHEVNGNTQKVPVLGDLPYIGAAFRAISYTEQESELLVLVTPHLVDPMSCDQLPKYLPGLETRSPDDCELFLEGVLEAPRGQRKAWPDCHYSAPYKSSPSAAEYPCGNGHCGGGACGNGSCAGGACAGAGGVSAHSHLAGPVDGPVAPIATPPLDSHAAAPAAGDLTPVAADVTPKAADGAPKAADGAPKAADAAPKPGELPALLPPPRMK